MSVRRLLIILAFLTLFAPVAAGVRAYPYPVSVQQPDGTTIRIIIHGDENGTYKTTPEGKYVIQDADGFYRIVENAPAVSVSSVRRGFESPLSINFAMTKALLNLNTLVIPVQFRNLPFSIADARSSIYNLFNQLNYSDNGATGSVRDYFRDNLGTHCNLTFDVANPVTVSEPYEYYGADRDGVTDRNIKELVVEACNAAHAAGVDFSKYDRDGDGTVDNVFIIFAGHNQAEGGGDDTIWPQSWNVSEKHLEYDGKVISGFSLYSEYSGATGRTFAGIGTICHEYCHMLGLPDMYDVNGDKEGQSVGLGGTLSIMDYGNYNNEGRTPPYLNIIERQMLGLVSSSSIKRETFLSLMPVQNAEVAYKLSSGTVDEDFWLEYRDGNKWDEYIGGSGLVLYHVDKSSNTAGSMTAKKRWSSNAVNGCSTHPCAVPVSSDGGEFSEVGKAFFPGTGGVSEIHSSRTFPLKDWSKKGIGLGISGIEKGATSLALQIVEDKSWNLPVVTDYSILPGQTYAQVQWATDKPYTGLWTFEWEGRSSVEKNTVQLGNASSCTLEDLVPGETYSCSFWPVYGSLTGKPVKIEFSTLKMLNNYPLIGGVGSRLKVGDVLHLMVLNLTEEYVSIRWYVDNVIWTASELHLEKAGELTLKAEIVYHDGSVEYLSKKLKVNE